MGVTWSCPPSWRRSVIPDLVVAAGLEGLAATAVPLLAISLLEGEAGSADRDQRFVTVCC